MFVVAVAIILVLSLLIGAIILYLLFSTGLIEPGGEHSAFYASIEFSNTHVEPERGNPFPFIVMIALPSIFITLLLFLVFGRTAIKPLNALSKGLGEIASGDFSVRLNEQALGQYGETNQNFNRMAQELENIELLREDFIVNVSHEFKTPLSSIQGYATLLQDPDLGESERREYLDAIFGATRSLSNLSSNILELSNLETQTAELPKQTFSLDEQIRQVIVILEPVCSEKKLELDIDLEEIDIVANQDLLMEVWINLIGNAIKFTEEGGSIAVRLLLLNKQGQAQVTIADTGCGMNEKELLHIFDKFYQAESSHKSEGNGLGLALVNTIIAKHNGNILVESSPGQGTSFSVSLPL